MLSLSRNNGESIELTTGEGDHLTVTVLDTWKNNACLKIDSHGNGLENMWVELYGVLEIVPLASLPIRIMLTKVNRNRVRLGFEAPESVKILRTELVERSDDDRTN